MVLQIMIIFMFYITNFFFTSYFFNDDRKQTAPATLLCNKTCLFANINIYIYLFAIWGNMVLQLMIIFMSEFTNSFLQSISSMIIEEKQPLPLCNKTCIVCKLFFYFFLFYSQQWAFLEHHLVAQRMAALSETTEHTSHSPEESLRGRREATFIIFGIRLFFCTWSTKSDSTSPMEHDSLTATALNRWVQGSMLLRKKYSATLANTLSTQVCITSTSALKNQCQNRNIVLFMPLILLPFHNLAPILPIMHLMWEIIWGHLMPVAVRAFTTASSSTTPSK